MADWLHNPFKKAGNLLFQSCIDPMQKGVSLFLSYTNMNKMNSLHHLKEHPKISNLLQFESRSSKSFKVRAT